MNPQLQPLLSMIDYQNCVPDKELKYCPVNPHSQLLILTLTPSPKLYYPFFIHNIKSLIFTLSIINSQIFPHMFQLLLFNVCFLHYHVCNYA